MASVFTPTDPVDMSKERDWGNSLGLMDWDATRIVFTKRSLLEFLRYTGTTVDTNFSNIQKLPRYATFGKLSDVDPGALASAPTEAPVAEEPASVHGKATPEGEQYLPSRHVRTAPGGPSSDIFGNAVDEGVLGSAPPKSKGETKAAAPPPPTAAQTASSTKETPMANFWDASDEPAFKPTRRVRENPGGTDHISQLF